MRVSRVELARPCLEDLDALGVDRSGPSFHCSRCDKQVHVLSNHTRAEAAALVPVLRAQRGCVLYLRSRSGEVVFREPASPLPTRQLGVRRHLASRAASTTPSGAPDMVEVTAEEGSSR